MECNYYYYLNRILQNLKFNSINFGVIFNYNQGLFELTNAFHISILKKKNKSKLNLNINPEFVLQYNSKYFIGKIKSSRDSIKTYHSIDIKNLMKSKLFSMKKAIIGFNININNKLKINNDNEKIISYGICLKIN